jgi:hypothetical protein
MNETHSTMVATQVRSAMRGSHISGFFVENDVIKESWFGMHISFPSVARASGNSRL